MSINVLTWIENWYFSHCDEDWEHEYGVTIETLDNPGWSIKIDLKFTNLQGLKIPYKLNELNNDNWWGISIENDEFHGIGDPNKLLFILTKFKELAEKK